jgi:NAD(P)-dependent dehydrogenase (short-subunit alcohol dehydrogenase family)
MQPLPHIPSRTSIDLRGNRILLTGAYSGIGEVAAQKLAVEGALDVVAPRALNGILERETTRMGQRR